MHLNVFFIRNTDLIVTVFNAEHLKKALLLTTNYSAKSFCLLFFRQVGCKKRVLQQICHINYVLSDQENRRNDNNGKKF